MIQLIEAPPGSGKTYFAVNYLCKFVSHDELYNEYSVKPNVLIISNIEGLKLPHWDLAECLKKRSMEEFFSIENFEKIMEKMGKNHVILAIDECHDYFPAGYKNEKIYSFFAYHRHIGLDIILMCQDLQATSRIFNPLLEFIVKATPRSRAVLNNFSYSFVTVKGHYLYSKSIVKKQSVFKAYVSQRQDEKNKPKNAVKHWIIITLVIFLSAGLLFKTALAIVKDKSEGAKTKTVVSNSTPQKSGVTASTTAPVAIESAGYTFKPITTAMVPRIIHAPPGYGNAPGQNAPGQTASADPGPISYGGPARVAGYIDSGARRRLLLSDGRIVFTSKNIEIGQIYR